MLRSSANHVPDYFNEHLCGVGGRQASQFNDAPPFVSTLKDVASGFARRPIRSWEVRDLIKKTKVMKSSAAEGLTSRILKDAFLVLQDQLCHNLNVSLTTCRFPTQWKLAWFLYIHLEENKLLSNHQWGFHLGRFTLDAGAGLV